METQPSPQIASTPAQEKTVPGVQIAQAPVQPTVQAPTVQAPVQATPALLAPALTPSQAQSSAVDSAVLSDFSSVTKEIDAMIASLANISTASATTGSPLTLPEPERTTAEEIESGLDALSVPHTESQMTNTAPSVSEVTKEQIKQDDSSVWAAGPTPIVNDTLKRVAEKPVISDHANEAGVQKTAELAVETVEVAEKEAVETDSTDNAAAGKEEKTAEPALDKPKKSNKPKKAKNKSAKERKPLPKKVRLALTIGIPAALAIAIIATFTLYYFSVTKPENTNNPENPSTGLTSPSTSGDSLVDRASPLFFQGGRGYVVFLKVPDGKTGVDITRLKFKSNTEGINFEVRNTAITKPRGGTVIGSGELKSENDVELISATEVKLIIITFDMPTDATNDKLITLSEFSVEQ